MEAQLAKWTGRKVGSDLRVEGPCPACRHVTRGNVPTTTTAFESVAADTGTDLTIALECACGEDHPGHADAPVGCGRSWTATARSHADGSVTLSPQDDPYLAEAAVAFRTEQTGQVDRLRAAGEKWIAGISAILGIVGLVGLGTGISRAQQLTMAGKYAVASAALIAVLAGVAAVYRAYQAAYGWPVTRAVGTDEELIEWFAASHDIPGRLARRLRQAAALAGLSAIALTVAVGMAALLPPAAPEVTYVRITRTDQSTVCGNLLTSNRDRTLLIRRADNGETDFVPVTEVTNVTLVKNCNT